MSMINIYDQYDAAFRDVSAYVITDAKGERVATVAFKFAKSGLRTTCYFHVLGLPMVRAWASGGGYDKCSAAIYKAVRKVTPGPCTESTWPEIKAFRDALKDQGQSWNRDLHEAGFNVLQAV